MKRTLFLERLGFNKREAEVYVSLLERGQLSLSDLARVTGFHRPALYKILPRLQEKGFVSVVPKGRYKEYVAESPKKLEQRFAELEAEYVDQMISLEDLYQGEKKKPRLKVYEGEKAITEIFSDIVTTLSRGDVFYRYSSRKIGNTMKLPKIFQQLRDKKQLERLVITSEAKQKTKRPRLEREIRVVPKDFDLFEDNVSLIIYADKVATIDHNTTMGYVVENETIARFQEKIFKLLYRQLR